MWYKIKRFFRRLFYAPKTTISPSTAERTEHRATTSYKTYTVALILGHTAKRPNATAYTGEREYFWNKKVRDFVFQKYKGKIKLVTIERPDTSYSSAMKYLAEECHELGVDLAIELHFDAAGVRTAKGGHFRTLKGDLQSKEIALEFMSGYLTRFHFVSERHRGCWEMKRGDAGYWFCYYMNKYGIESMLFEPFFADYKTDESEPFLEVDGHKLMSHYWIAELDKLEKKLNL